MEMLAPRIAARLVRYCFCVSINLHLMTKVSIRFRHDDMFLRNTRRVLHRPRQLAISPHLLSLTCVPRVTGSPRSSQTSDFSPDTHARRVIPRGRTFDREPVSDGPQTHASGLRAIRPWFPCRSR